MYLVTHTVHGQLLGPLSMDDLIKEITSTDFLFPRPNMEKMKAELERSNSFSYGCKMIHIFKIEENT